MLHTKTNRTRHLDANKGGALQPNDVPQCSGFRSHASSSKTGANLSLISAIMCAVEMLARVIEGAGQDNPLLGSV
jgi:hypothetical protein